MRGLQDTGERLVFENLSEITIEHLHRYAFAQDFVIGKIVLDVACGEGYGANFLANYAQRVIGCDIDEKTINWASSKYSESNLEFLCTPIEKLPLDDSSIDVVVSYETIEHVLDPNTMMKELKRVLKNDGILLISTPDKKHYSDDRNYKNPFHVKEFYLEEFKSFMQGYFLNNHHYLQKTVNYTSIISFDNSFKQIRFYDGLASKIEKIASDHKIIVTVSSNIELTKKTSSIFSGSMIRDSLEIEKLRAVRNSVTFKIGKLIVFPFSKIKRFFI